MMPKWLPALIINNGYKDWNQYFDDVYRIFERDFVLDKPVYKNIRLGLKKHPEYNGKSATFWHLISEGKIEEERLPCTYRCERIAYPKPIIDNSNDKCLKIWIELRKGEKRIHIWYEDENYLVVLAQRGNYILPWTAFYIKEEHRKKKYNKRWNQYKTPS